MRLNTKRLTLIPLDTIDEDLFHSTNIDPFVRKYLWDNQEISKSISVEILKEVESKFLEEQWGLWKIIHSLHGEYMGYVGFWRFFDEPQPQLLYALLPIHTGNGFATEASRAVIKYAFEVLNFDYLIASMDKPNEASIQVCRRLNMDLVDDKLIEGKLTLFFRINKTPNRIKHV